MRKYLTIGIILLALVLLYNILNLYTGFYIDFNKNKKINYSFYEKEGKIFLGDNVFQIKGVEINSFYPGYEFSDYKIEKDTYLKWFKQIADMGANTLKATNRLNPEFYDALYEFNTNNKNKLYLIQCIEIEEYETNNANSIYGFKDKLLKEGLLAIDIIHGNRYIVTSGISGSGWYNKDVSEWTIGYIITSIGKEETISYTDYTDKKIAEKGYDGEYFYTNPAEASETECIVAEIMDKMTSYETKKYKEQRLISLMIDVLKDPFEYKENVNVQLGKMAFINMNDIKTKEKLKTGKIVSYDLAGAVNQFIELLAEEEIEKHQELLSQVNFNTVCGGYIDFINRYYDSPVLIASYSFSTSRAIEKEYTSPYTEEKQGQKLVEYYNDFINLGSCGGIISSWQDNWALTTWNVKYSTKEEKEVYWFNKESVAQCNGLLTFETQDRENICYVDGDKREWTDDNLIFEQNGIKLYSKYDLENVYIMADNINNNVLYIPIDTTRNSGAASYQDINFSREADFIIKINSLENGEILVQEYYDSIRAMYEDNITGTLQYSNVPDKNTNNFVRMRTILTKKLDASVDISHMRAEQRKQYRMYRTDIAGILEHGNSNPNSEEYNSLADYCFGENCVEIQIPWQLLNFSSPSEMLIHDDYYKNYGIEDIKIKEMYIGIGENNIETINFGKMELKPWNKNVKVQERLKKSYNIVKEAWNKE